MTRTQTIGVVAAVALALVGVLAGVGAGLHRKDGKQSTTIRLSSSNGGPCTAKIDDDRLGGNKKQELKWKVINDNCSPQYVVLQQGTVDTSVIAPYPVPSGSPIAPGSTVDLPAATVQKNSIWILFDEVYKYEVWIGDSNTALHSAIDPDIDVWP